MARIYYNNPTAKNGSAESLTEARDWLINHSNGNLTAFGEVETISSIPCVHLKFQNSGLYIRITQYSGTITGIKLSVHTRNEETWSNSLKTISNTNVGQNGNYYTLEYAEIDDCLFRISFLGSSSNKGSLALAKFSVQGKQYIGLSDTVDLDFFYHTSDAMIGNSSITIYDILEQDIYSTTFFRFPSSCYQLLKQEDALLCPVLSYAKPTIRDRGVIEWNGNTGRNLYYLNTSQGDKIFVSGANYIINGQSYKACAQRLYVFL